MCNGKVWNSAFRRALYHHVNARRRGMATKTDGMLPSDSSREFYGCGFPTISPPIRYAVKHSGRDVSGVAGGAGFSMNRIRFVSVKPDVNFYLVINVHLIVFYSLLVIDLFGKIKSGFSLFLDLFQIPQVRVLARIPSIN
jgi:hypothetical protein